MQGGIKKEYRILYNKPVLVHSLLTFITTDIFYKLVITVPPAERGRVKKIISPFLNPDKLDIIEGGTTRQESVYFALKTFKESNPDYILVHDGARPWITCDLITRVFNSTKEYGACIPVIDVPDALKEIDEKGIIIKGLSRNRIKGAQTPQGFIYKRLLEAHQCAQERKMKALDDAEVYSILYHPVVTIPGDVQNRKITYCYDIS